jgi:drug/metabolite transporter (DMT)-like permease
MQDRRFDFTVLAIGVLAVSTAALFIREADAPALVIAAARLTLASIPLLAWTGVQGVRTARTAPGTLAEGQTGKGAREIAVTLAAGIFLALHFGFWVASIKQTSIVTSVVLVTAQPLFVALAAGPMLGERAGRTTWTGIAIAALGAAVMVGDDANRGSQTMLGDLYAILGAIFAAGYFLAGRSLRTSGVAWLPYVTRVYSVAAVALVVAAVVAGEAFTGYSGRTYGFFVLLALVPQLIGHTALNRSLGYLPAASVTIAVLGEPVGATILAAFLLDETPTLLQSFGALLVLAGVYAGLKGSFATSTMDEAPETM